MSELSRSLLLDPWDERWVGFVASKHRANVFHHPAWMTLMAECYSYRPFIVTICDASGRVSAGLPVMEVNSPLTGRRWVSLPFSDHCVPLYLDGECLNRLVDNLVCLSRKHRTPRIEVRWGLPNHPAIRSYSSYVLHTIELGPDADSVIDRVQGKKRRTVRSARRKGEVRIELGNTQKHLWAFYRMHLLTRRRHGVPVQPTRFFKLLGKLIIEQGLGSILLAYRDEQCLAAGVFLYWQDTLTYKYSASSGLHESLRPSDQLMWAAIHWGCENGFKLLDLGRTDVANAGLREFKKRWGAEEMPLIYSSVSSSLPRPANGKLASVMGTVIQKSPVWVCRVTGELLYRHFG